MVEGGVVADAGPIVAVLVGLVLGSVVADAGVVWCWEVECANVVLGGGGGGVHKRGRLECAACVGAI